MGMADNFQNCHPDRGFQPDRCDLRFARSAFIAEEPQIPRLRCDAARLHFARDDNSIDVETSLIANC
jgi:hypothetical protein